MRNVRFRRRTLTTATSSTVLAAGAVLLIVSAVFATGFPVQHVSLNDGGIWVTSDADHLFGRLNKPAGQLDAAFYPPGGAQDSSSLDVVQQGAAVAAWDQGSGVLYPVDVSRGVPAGDDGRRDRRRRPGGTRRRHARRARPGHRCRLGATRRHRRRHLRR